VGFRGLDEEQATLQRIVFRRLATGGPGFQIDDVLDAETTDGKTIIDSRASLVYQIGSDRMNLAGYWATLPAPIEAPLPIDAMLKLDLRFTTSPDTVTATPTSAGWTGRTLTTVFLLVTFASLALIARQSSKRAGLATLIVLLICGVGAYALHSWLDARGRAKSPVDPYSHDFGEFPFEEAGITKEHEFRVVNRTERTREIVGVRTSCGCSVGTLSDREVAIGEAASLRANLRFSQPGERSESIWVIYKDGEVDEFKIRGTATSASRTWCINPVVQLTPGPERQIFAATSSEPSVSPGTPALTLPPGISGEFLGWNLIDVGDPESSRLRRWHGAWVIKADDPLAANEIRKLQVSYDDGGDDKIDISGWPWR
jgi:hypothetical protein